MAILDEFLILFTTQVRGNGIQQVNKQIAGTTKSLLSASNMLKVFFGYDLYQFIRQLIPDLIATSQQLGAMESRFNAVSTSARAGAEELKWVGDQSKRLGLNFLKTADDYSIFYATVRKNMGQDTTRKVFQDWAEAFRVLHIDPERQSRVLYALREMSSKGKIYMQDLALQLGSAVPDAMNLAATSMGYTGPKAVERFREAIRKGEVDVKKFIPAFSQMVNSTYVNSDKLARAMNLPDAQIQLLTTHWQFMQKKMYEGGFGKDLVSLLKFLNSGLGFLEKHGESLYKVFKVLAGVLLLIGGLRAYSWIAKASVAAVGLISRMGSFIGLMRILIGLIGSPALRLVLAIFSGPTGWIIAGIALLAYMMNKFFPNVTKALWNLLTVLRIKLKTMMDEIIYQWNTFGPGSWGKKDKKKGGNGEGWYSNEGGVPRLFGIELKGMKQIQQGKLDEPLFNRSIPSNSKNTMMVNNTTHINPKIDIKVTAEGGNPEDIMEAIERGNDQAVKKLMDKLTASIPNSKLNGRPTRSGYESLLPLSTIF